MLDADTIASYWNTAQEGRLGGLVVNTRFVVERDRGARDFQRSGRFKKSSRGSCIRKKKNRLRKTRYYTLEVSCCFLFR
jgi:hypothetical protein